MKAFLTLALICLVHLAHAQAPAVEWQHSYGGPAYEEARSALQTADGGFIVAGYSFSSSGDITANHGAYDGWLMKLSPAGVILWQKNYGGSNDDEFYHVIQTADGGYLLTGVSTSSDGDVAANHGNYDIWLVKTDDTGHIQWEKSFGGTDDDFAFSAAQTTDGGYIVAGFTQSADGDVTVNHGGTDVWLIRLSGSGLMTWQKTCGGSGSDLGVSVRQTADGGFVVAGQTSSTSGDITANHGGSDAWVIKTNDTGAITWQKTYGGSANDAAWSIRQTVDSGYIIAAQTFSSDGDVTLNHGAPDYWVLKLSSSGALQWQKTYGGAGIDNVEDIEINAHGYLVSGASSSSDGNLASNHGGFDAWVLQLSDSGTILWQRSLGGLGDDRAFVAIPCADGGALMAGYTNSSNGDVTLNLGSYDYWVVKLTSPSGIPENNADAPVSIYPNPTTGQLRIVIAGPVQIRICAPDGREVLSEVATDNVSIAALPPGMYIVSLYRDGNILSRSKLVKQ